ncbi:MAG: hypothetical protein II874_03220 [Bacteroidales bacterium]|nr:hypothetical protein [Bacteroidales bacterium]
MTPIPWSPRSEGKNCSGSPPDSELFLAESVGVSNLPDFICALDLEQLRFHDERLDKNGLNRICRPGLQVFPGSGDLCFGADGKRQEHAKQ